MITLPRTEVRKILFALGEYQTHLESVIESHTIPGWHGCGEDSADERDRAVAAEARAKNRQVEEVVRMLEGKLRR